MRSRFAFVLLFSWCAFVSAEVLDCDGFDYPVGSYLGEQVSWNQLILHVPSPVIADYEAATGLGSCAISILKDGETALRSKALPVPVDVQNQTVYITGLVRVIDEMEEPSASVRFGLANTFDPGQHVEAIFAGHAHTVFIGGDGGGGSNSNTSFEKGVLYRCVLRIKPHPSEDNKLLISAGWFAVDDSLTLKSEDQYEYQFTDSVYDPGKNPCAKVFQYVYVGFVGPDQLIDELMVCNQWADFQSPYVAPITPTPSDDADSVMTQGTKLAWTVSPFAEQYDVFLGTDENAVKAAKVGGGLHLKSQTGTSLVLDEDLANGQQYFWRVDEVKVGDPSSPRLNLWQFTTESFGVKVSDIIATASDLTQDPQLTVDGSGLDVRGEHDNDENNMWRGTSAGQPVWIQYAFGRPISLSEMKVWNYNFASEIYLGFGMQDVSIETSLDGEHWTVLKEVVFNRAPGKSGYPVGTTIPMDDVLASHVKLTAKTNYNAHGAPLFGLSEVQFLTPPYSARPVSPLDEAVDLNPNECILRWKPGLNAQKYDVLLGSSMDQMELVGTTQQTSMNVSDRVILGQDYYWKVNAISSGANPEVWESGIASFTMSDFISIDDMETYKNWGGYHIYDTWLDGYNNPSQNGCTVGNGDDPELDTIYSYFQAMPLYYSNLEAPISHATRTFDCNVDQCDWQKGGIKHLVFWMSGDPNNTGGSFYVEVNGARTNLASLTLSQTEWVQVVVNLAELNTDLNTVNTLTFGVTGAHAEGVLYIDDIRLYNTAPSVSLVTNSSFEDRGGKIGRIATDGKSNTEVQIPGWTCTWESGYVGWDRNPSWPAYTGSWNAFVNNRSAASFKSDAVSQRLNIGDTIDIQVMLAANTTASSAKCTLSLVLDQEEIIFDEVFIEDLTNLEYVPVNASYKLAKPVSQFAVSIRLDNDFNPKEADQVRLDEVSVTVFQP